MKQDRKFILTGMVLPFNRRGCSGRIYTRESVLKAFQDLKARINGGFVGGVLEQNQYNFGPGFSLGLEDLSHKVTSVELKNDGIYASLEILDTPKGNLVKQMVDAGVKLWGSQRAIGMDQLGTITLDSIISYDLTGCSSFDPNDLPPLGVNCGMKQVYVVKRMAYDRLEDYKPGDVPIHTSYLKLTGDIKESQTYTDDIREATHFMSAQVADEWIERLELQKIPSISAPYRHEATMQII